MKRMKNGIPILLALTLLTGCGAPSSSEPPELLEPVSVVLDTTPVKRGTVLDAAFYSAAVVPSVEEIRPERGGVLAEVSAYTGQSVKKGDRLASFDTSAAGEKLQALREELESARQAFSFESQKKQIDIRIAQQELAAIPDDYTNQAASHLKRLEIEQLQLEFSQMEKAQALKEETLQAEIGLYEAASLHQEIRAPFAGRILWVCEEAQAGRSVSPQTVLFYLADDSRLSLVSDLVEDSLFSDALSIQAEIDGRAYAITPRELSISDYFAITQAGQDPRTHYDFVSPDSSLRSGQTASICLEYGRADEVLWIPANALYRSGSECYVYRMEEGKQVRQEVEIGLATSVNVEIRSGLQEGDLVYVKSE